MPPATLVIIMFSICPPISLELATCHTSLCLILTCLVQLCDRRSGMVLNYSSGDEVIAALPSSSPSSSSCFSSPNATSTSSSALSSSPGTFEGSTTAVRTPTVFTSSPLSPTSPTASISPSPPSPSPSLPSPPSRTSSPASPCESLSHSPSSSPTPTISSPSIPSIQEESASLLVSYYNATTCFPSSSSGITDDESTISTDSGTDNAEISTNGDVNQNSDNNDNNEDLSHLRNDEFDENKNGNIHNNLYAISTIPLQNTIYNNYCTKYDIVSDTSYDNLNGNLNVNKGINKYDGKTTPNKRKNKNQNKYQNKQNNVACNTNDSRITTNKQKENQNDNETDIESEYVNKIEEKCDLEVSEEKCDSSEVSRIQWCISTPQKCQDIYTSLTHSHDMGCEDKFLESSQTSSSSNCSSSSSTSPAVDVRYVLESDRGDKENYEEIDIDDNINEKVNHHKSSLIQTSSIATSTSDNVDESKINDDSNKSTQTERVYVFKSHKIIQNSNINSMIIKQKNTIEYPFTMEQALLVAEVLYVLRPVVYAWTVHYIQERKRKRSRNNEDELNSIINNVGAGVGEGTWAIPVGTRSSDSTNNGPSSAMRNDDAPASGKRGPGSDDPAEEENSFFSSLEDFLPLLLSLVSTDIRACVCVCVRVQLTVRNFFVAYVTHFHQEVFRLFRPLWFL